MGRSSGLGLKGNPGLIGMGPVERPLKDEAGVTREPKIDPRELESPTFGGDLVANSLEIVSGLLDTAVSRDPEASASVAILP
jgi:hypothetical protein